MSFEPRDACWDVYQAAARRLHPDLRHVLVHVERLEGKSLTQRHLLTKDFWRVVLPSGCLELVDTAQAWSSGQSPDHLVSAAPVHPDTPLRLLDGLLCSDRFHLLALPGSQLTSIQPLLEKGWSYAKQGAMQFPDALLACMSTGDCMGVMPLGRFDDPDRSVVALGLPHWAAALASVGEH